jgi:hypothetical protein
MENFSVRRQKGEAAATNILGVRVNDELCEAAFFTVSAGTANIKSVF